MKTVFIKQVAFEHWANTELFKSLVIANPLPERALFLFSHIISANIIWLNRLKEESISSSLFQERTLPECAQLLIDNNLNWSRYIRELDIVDLEGVIRFDFPIDGTVRTISKMDAIFHLTNHSSYHRGQIISLIKGNVKDLPALGFVFFASKIL